MARHGRVVDRRRARLGHLQLGLQARQCRHTLHQVAHALQQARVLSYSRGQIEINDMDALLQTSCECYRSVKVRQEKLIK